MNRDRFKKIYIEITNKCNLNCDFCLKTDREKRSMSKEEFKLVLNKIRPYSKYLYFHVLGEPLMHPNINELIDEASKDFNVNITTNGYLINKINTENIRQINISLHSFNEIYGKSIDDYLNDILSFINKYKENTYINLRLWVKTKYYSKIVNFFKNKFNKKIIEENNILDNNVYLNFDKEFVWPENSNQIYKNSISCRALKDHIAILSNGHITACCLDGSGKINLGNIFNDDLSDVISSSLFQSMLKGFENGERIHELCKKCNFINEKRKIKN